MRIPKQVILTFLLLISNIILWNGCAPATSVRLHPDFVESPDIAHSVTLLPPECEVIYLVFTGDNQRLPEREKELESLLSQIVPGILQSQQYEPYIFNFPSDDQASMEARYTLEQLRTAYGKSLSDMYPKKKVTMKLVTDVPGEIGPMVNQLVSDPETDALLFIKYSGFKKSPGLLAKETAGGVLLGLATGTYMIPVSEGGTLQAALIDGTTGNILWHNYAVGQESFEKLIEGLFASFPNYNENLGYYVESGIEIFHPFKVKDLGVEMKQDLNLGPDQILLKDGRSFSGEVIDTSKRDCMMRQRQTCYIINRKKIEQVTINGQIVTLDDLDEISFKRVNYNTFEERIEID